MNKRLLIAIFLGFSSGLPLLATGSTLQAWMIDAQVDLKVIGVFSLAGLPFTLKFLWAPVMDRFVPPFLGRRRGWILVTQIALMLTFLVFGQLNPAQSLTTIALLAVLINFFAASQDIVLDAHRRDILLDNELSFGSSLFVTGYRVGMLTSGAAALWLADHAPWSVVYSTIAAFMGVGICACFAAPEPEAIIGAPRTMKEAIFEPLKEYFSRKSALLILLFIFLYKLGEQMASAMLVPFYLDIGFSKTEIAQVGKAIGLLASIGGGLLGGVLCLRLGVGRSLIIFGIMQALCVLGFSMLSMVGYSMLGLTLVVGAEYLTSGMATAAFVGFMGSVTDKRFSATQFALLSSLLGIPRVVAAAPTGYLAHALGWQMYFLFCAVIAIPALLMVPSIVKDSKTAEPQKT